MVALLGQEFRAAGPTETAHVKDASSLHGADCSPGAGGGLLDL